MTKQEVNVYFDFLRKYFRSMKSSFIEKIQPMKGYRVIKEHILSNLMYIKVIYIDKKF